MRANRLANAEAYEAEMVATFASRDFDEWCEMLRQSSAPWAPVQSAPRWRATRK